MYHGIHRLRIGAVRPATANGNSKVDEHSQRRATLIVVEIAAVVVAMNLNGNARAQRVQTLSDIGRDLLHVRQ